MHISKVDGMYPVAFKPNNVVFKPENSDSMLEHLLLLNLFVIPGTWVPEDRVVKIDVNLITSKKLKGSICSRLKNALTDVCKAQFEIYQNDKNYKFVSVFESVERKEDVITAVLTNSALEVLKNSRTKNFTKISIEDALRLNTPNQIGLLALHLACSNCKRKTELTLDEIKKSLGIPKEMYKTWPHLRQRVIDPSYAGINKNLGFNLGYKPVKAGNKTVSIKPSKLKRTSKTPNTATTTEEEDCLFDFASECFKLLPVTERNLYKKDLPDYIGDTTALISAVDKFIKQHSELLKRSKTAEEFIRLLNT